MAIELNEPVVHAVRDRLNANLAAHITAINAAAATVADGFTIENPAAVLDYIPSPGELVNFPTVGIGDGRQLFRDDIGHNAELDCHITVVAYLADADQRALAWRLRRYSQAIARTILADRNLGTAAYGTGLDRVDPGPTLASDESPRTFLSWIAVTIRASRDEV